jgi:hypothetical protein
MAAAEAAPEELSAIANVMPAMPMPFVPEEHHGKLVVMALMAYAGNAEAGQQAMAPFRALATPIADMVEPMPYPQIYGPPPQDGAEEYRPTAVATTMFVDRIDRDAAAFIVDTLNASNASIRVAQLRVLGGASARVPIEATAYAHRAAPIMVNLAAFYEGEDDRILRQAWLDEFAAGFDRGRHGAYVNFLGDEGEARVRAAYPGATWDRLAAIKASYDPTNLFRGNQNIAPAASAG